ncbi:hypothetical protein BGX29_004140 [Mortierella sp. GBA35]|nr:hypothetical protein BGX29_004140 [Mortierella sp. GBA35]
MLDHGTTLRSLKLHWRSSSGPALEIILSFLMGCPNLELLSINIHTAHLDMFKALGSQPWACRQLQQLRLSVFQLLTPPAPASADLDEKQDKDRERQENDADMAVLETISSESPAMGGWYRHKNPLDFRRSPLVRQMKNRWLRTVLRMANRQELEHLQSLTWDRL